MSDVKMSVERPSGIDLSLSMRRRAPDAWDKCQVRRPLLEPPRRDVIDLWTPRPVDCEPRVRPRTINYHRRPVTITPDRMKKEGDFTQSFFGMDMERAGMLLREYLDDKLRAPERVSEQEREQFLRIVQNIPPLNQHLESLIESVIEMMQTREGNLMTPADDDLDVPTVDEDEDNDQGDFDPRRESQVVDDTDEKDGDDDSGRGDEGISIPERDLIDPRHSSAAFGLPSYGTAVRSPQTQPITINSRDYGGTWSQLKATIESYGIRGRILDRSTGRENSIDTVVGKMIRGRKGGRKYKLYLEQGYALLTLVGN